MATKKRGALENPALSYLSEIQKSEVLAAPTLIALSPSENATGTKCTTNYKAMLQQVEARSKRLQCLMQPSLFDKVKAIANRRGVPLNDLVHTTLEALAESEKRDIGQCWNYLKTAGKLKTRKLGRETGTRD